MTRHDVRPPECPTPVPDLIAEGGIAAAAEWLTGAEGGTVVALGASTLDLQSIAMQGLALQRAFTRIGDGATRARVVQLVEGLAGA